ncbi:unnamed protein product, partial [Nesidiocoris tenuis]
MRKVKDHPCLWTRASLKKSLASMSILCPVPGQPADICLVSQGRIAVPHRRFFSLLDILE